MARIEWDDSYSVNNQEMDSQHKKWIEIFNKFHTDLLEGDTIRLMTLTEESLEAIEDFAEYHFEFEEKYMKKIGFPELDSHKKGHQTFIDMIYGFKRDIGSGNVLLNSTIINDLRNWILNHILVEDRKYKIFFEEKNRQS